MNLEAVKWPKEGKLSTQPLRLSHMWNLFHHLVIDLTLPLLITALCPFFSFRTSLQYIAWDRIKSTLGDSKASLKILISIPWKKRIPVIEIGRKIPLWTLLKIHLFVHVQEYLNALLRFISRPLHFVVLNLVLASYHQTLSQFLMWRATTLAAVAN